MLALDRVEPGSAKVCQEASDKAELGNADRTAVGDRFIVENASQCCKVQTLWNMLPEFLTQWTIRLALLALVARLVCDLVQPHVSRQRMEISRWLWTAGCALLWVHVGLAFHFYHHWSHRAALLQTARDTAAVTGLAWG